MKPCHIARFCNQQWDAKLREAKGEQQIEREKQMGIKSTHPEVRRILRENPDGLTIKQLAELMGREIKHLHITLRAMPDTYVDRWIQTKPQAQWSAVWCAVEVPEDCPRPDRRWIKGKRIDGHPRIRPKNKDERRGLRDRDGDDYREDWSDTHPV